MFKKLKKNDKKFITIILTFIFIAMGDGFTSWFSPHYDIKSNPTFSQITLRGGSKFQEKLI